jgi:hypothetical protein
MEEPGWEALVPCRRRAIHRAGAGPDRIAGSIPEPGTLRAGGNMVWAKCAKTKAEDVIGQTKPANASRSCFRGDPDGKSATSGACRDKNCCRLWCYAVKEKKWRCESEMRWRIIGKSTSAGCWLKVELVSGSNGSMRRRKAGVAREKPHSAEARLRKVATRANARGTGRTCLRSHLGILPREIECLPEYLGRCALWKADSPLDVRASH